MEFLTTNTQYTNIGYPIIIWYLCATIGIILVFYRSYYAFLFALFCLSARNFHAAVFTRTPFFGPFVNLNDLLMWIALFALLIEVFKKRKIYVPKILFAIFGLLLIGDLQSLFKYSLIEEVYRRIWQSAIFPLLFLVSVNMVTDTEKAKSFFLVFFVGSVVAAVQHIFYIIRATSYGFFSEAQIRTISYITSGGLFLVIAFIFSKLKMRFTYFKINFYYLGMAVIIFSYIMSLTRAIYVGLLGVFAVIPFFLHGGSIRKAFPRTAILAIFVLLVVQILFQNLGFGEILDVRIRSFIYRETFEESYKSRLSGQKSELDLWLNSSIIFGVGSTLPYEIGYTKSQSEELGALYHVAYSTYLAHYGVAGLLIYAILLPFLTIRIAKRYYTEHIFDYGGMIAITGIAISLFSFFTLPTSYHYLGATSHMDGLIYGAVWGLYRGDFLKMKRRLSKNAENNTMRYGNYAK